jgi:signal transduction histidine kinase/CheY-like chemotaxis protein
VSSTRLMAPQSPRARLRHVCDAAVALGEATSTEAVLDALARHVESALGARKARARVVGPDEVPAGAGVAALLVGKSGDVWGVIEVDGYELDEDLADRDAVLAALASMGAAALEREARCARERAARQRAETEGRLKDELVATVSHELRTPLQAILGWTRLLQASPETPTDRALQVVERNALAQVALIDDLVDATHVLSGRTELVMQGFDLAELVRGVCDAQLPAASARGVSLEAGSVSGSVIYRGDEARLRRVLVNLLASAVKLTPPKGVVEVGLHGEPGSIVVQVSASGHELSGTSLPFGFERFRHGDSSDSARTGLGVGLAIVKQLVALHAGHVFAESRGPGRGATFRVVLPVDEARAEDGAPPRGGQAAPAPVRPVLVGRRVLVVEDDLDALELARVVLEGAGAEVMPATSCGEAVTILHSVPVDVVVSDIALPGDDGYRLLRHLRGLGGDAARTPVLAFTALASEGDRDRALRAGFSSHLAKPALPHELVRAVEAALAGSTAR